jgi:hypothetical protein
MNLSYEHLLRKKTIPGLAACTLPKGRKKFHGLFRLSIKIISNLLIGP